MFNRRTILGAFLVAVAIVGGLGVYGYMQTRSANVASVREQLCKKLVKDRLKAPSTVQWVEVRRSNDDVFIEYDAENSYNATLRGNAECFFERADNRWSLTGAVINGRDVPENIIGLVDAQAAVEQSMEDGASDG